MAWLRSMSPSSGPSVRYYPEAASQSFKKGDPVKLNTSGQVLLAVDTESGPWAIANADASGTTNAEVGVTLMTVGDVFVASASAAGATRTVTQSDVGLQCSWIKSTVTGETDKSVLDQADTTTPSFEIVDTYDDVGTVDGRYEFRILAPVARAA
jgi:hypothetical protein